MLGNTLIETQAAKEEKPTSLRAVAELFEALNEADIHYCHWKSNLRLAEAMRGLTDMDLLVDHEQRQAFLQILLTHDIKPIVAPPSKDYPGIENYLGFDQSSGRLFHLHVHYRLVLGEQFVKNYHLPLESLFLGQIQMQRGVKIPVPELELAILSVRALLKYRDRDVVKDLLHIRSPGLPDHIRSEIDYLQAQTSGERIQQVLRELDGVVPAEIMSEFLDLVAHAPRAGYRLYKLRRQVRQALRPYQRYSRSTASLKYFRELSRRKMVRRFSQERNLTPAGGGQTLALVGVDGAGKSTMLSALHQWLAWRLDVRVYYLGSKQPSIQSELLYLFFRAARRSHRAVSKALGDENVLSRFLEKVRQTFLYSHHLSIGYDRYGRYRAAEHRAAQGSIVLCDRYPLVAPLDGPMVHLDANGQMDAITKAFSSWERNLYDKIQPADHFIVLNVEPAVSLERKPDHSPEAIEAKYQAVKELVAKAEREPDRWRLIHVDANLPYEQVLGRLKARIWEVI